MNWLTFFRLGILVVFLGAAVQVQAQCSHPDYDALMALYNSTNGDSWTNSGTNDDRFSTTEGWAKDCDVCEWYRINCNGDGRVISIELGNNSLSGSLPDELGDLMFLETFDIGSSFANSNEVSGNLPNNLTNLANLLYFDIAFNDFDGNPFPVFITITSLLELRITGNRFTGNIPVNISNLSNIEHLVIGENNLTGTIPTSIWGMTTLTYLHITDNNITGELPAEIDNLQNLERLWIGDTQIFGEIPNTIGNMLLLEEIDLQDNDLSGFIPASLGNITNLERLQLENNDLEGEVPDNFGNLVNLEFFSLKNNDLEGEFPAYITTFAELLWFDLSSNNFTGELPGNIGTLSRLARLYLDNNQLSGTLPTSIANLSNLDQLRLENNFFEGEIPIGIGDLDRLQSSSIGEAFFYGNNLNGCFPADLLNLSGIDVRFYNNPQMPWEGDFDQFLNTDGSQAAQIGAPCDDGNTSTLNDAIGDDCNCSELMVCPPDFDLTFTASSNEICEGELVDLQFDFGAGQPPYTVNYQENNGALQSWNNLDANTSLTESPTATTVYDIISITDADGCIDNTTYSLTVTVNTLPDINPVTTNDVCFNGIDNYVDLTQYDNALSTGNTITWWENASATVSAPDPTFYFFDTPGLITLYARAEDPATGCLSTIQAVDFDVNDLPVISIVEIIGDFCEGEELEYVLEITGGEPPYTGGIAYDGQTFATFTDEFNTTVSVFVTFPSAGNYGYTNTPAFVSDVNECPPGVEPLPFFEQAVAPRPVANPIPSLTACFTANGDATFDLTLVNDDINNDFGIFIEWYTDETLTNTIFNPSNHVISNDETVYAVAISNEGCQSDPQPVDLTPDFLDDLAAGEDQPVSTPGGSDGVGFVIIEVGTPPFEIIYSTAGFSDFLETDELGTTLIPGLIAGDYDLTITDDNGCQALTTFTITEPDCTVDGGTLTGGSFTFCVGDGNADMMEDGAVTLSGANGMNTIWVVTDANGIILGLPENYATVNFDGAGTGACLLRHLSYEDGLEGLEAGENIADLAGCFDLSNTITVNRVTSGPACEPDCDLTASITASTTSLACNGDTNAQLDLVTNGSFTITSIVWSNPDWNGQTTVENVGAGTHSVTVTDVENCTANTSVTISEPPGISFACAGNPVTDEGPGRASVTIFNGGTPPFTISWTGSSSGSISDVGYELVTIDNPLVASNYSVTIEEVNGCSHTCEIPVADISTPDCTHPDYPALIALYNSTNGANWTNNTGWAAGAAETDCEPCNWFGIACDVNNRVITLDLTNNNLDGTLPDAISGLAELRVLHLDNNDFSGTLTDEIGSLTNLIVLQINLMEANSMGFSGPLPASLGNLSNLTRLDLGWHRFSEELPISIGQLSNLEALVLELNDFSGGIPSEWGGLTSIREIKLFECGLSGTLPASIQFWTQLETLDLSFNGFSGNLPDEIQFWTGITDLRLNNNNFSGAIPSEFQFLNNLQSLYLNDNNFSECYFESINNLCGVAELDFSGNPLLPWEGDFSQYCAGGTQVGASCDDGNAATTEEAIQENCSCAEPIGQGCLHPDYMALMALFSNTNGEDWTFNGTNDDPTSITEGWGRDCEPCGWYGIRCNVAGRVICIDLDGDNNCDPSFTAGNNLFGSLPTGFDDLPFLEDLYLESNRIFGSIPDFIGFPMLEALYLGRNDLGGNIPNFSGMPNLINFSCRYNDLEGTIPNFTNLVNLRGFSCRTNNLEGPIPDFINLPNLESFSFNENNLSGCYPDFACTILSFVGIDNPLLPWQGDHLPLCQEGEPQLNAPCDDGNPNTTNDRIQGVDCGCAGDALGGGVTLSMPEITALQGTNFCVSIIVNDFIDILGMQFSVNYDSELLSFDEAINLSTDLPGFQYIPESSSSSIGNPSPGNITFTWNDPNAQGISLVDGTTLVELCFISQTCGSSEVTFSGSPTPIEFINGDEQELSFQGNSGQVTITSNLELTAINQSNPGCGQTNNGFIELSVTNGEAPYSFQWSNGDTTARIENLMAGAYTATVTDSRNCSAVSEVIPLVEVNDFVLTCPPSQSLIIEADSSGILLLFPAPNAGSCALDSLRYTLSGAIVQGETLGVLPVTFFPVGVTTVEYYVPGQDTCSFDITITQVADPCMAFGITANAVVTPLCLGDEDGSIDITVLNGTGPYTYSWSNGATTEDLNDLPAGLYTLTLTDANACEVAASFWLQEPDPFSVTAVVVNDTEDAGGSGSILLTPGNIPLPYTVEWFNAMNDPIGIGLFVNQLTTGTYSATITDGGGCMQSFSYEISQLTEAVAITPDCDNEATGSIELEIEGTAPFEYEWSAANDPDFVATESFIENLPADVYTVTITDATTARIIRTYQVPANTLLLTCESATPASGSDNADGTATITLSDGELPYNLSFTNADGPVADFPLNMMGDFTFTNLPGDYTVSVTDANGCEANCAFTIENATPVLPVVLSVPDIATTSNTPICIPISISGFTDVSGFQFVLTYDTSALRFTELTNVHPNFSPDASIEATVQEDGLLLNWVLLLGGSIDLPADAILTEVCFESLNCGAQFLNIPLPGESVTAEFITESLADLPIEATGGSLDVVSDLELSLIIGNPTCEQANGVVSAEVLNGSDSYTYLWNAPGNTAMLSNLAAGTSYALTVTDLETGCTATAETEMLVNQGTPFTITLQETICQGESYAFNGQQLSESGTYEASFITSPFNCDSTITLILEVRPIPVAEIIGDTTFCPGDGPQTLTVTLADTYQWSTGSTTQSTTIGSALTEVSVTITNAAGCTSSDTVQILSGEVPEIIISGEQNVCDGQSTLLTASGGITYHWSNGSTNATTELLAGTHAVEVTNAAGCTNIRLVTVTNNSLPMLPAYESEQIGCGNGTLPSLELDVVAPLTVNWYTENNELLAAGQTTYSPNEAGTYLARIIDIATGCESVDVAVFNYSEADIISPVINDCPADLLVVLNTAMMSEVVVDWEEPTAVDNCEVASFSSTLLSGSAISASTQVTYTATDAAGNDTGCSFNINVEQTDPLTIYVDSARITVTDDMARVPICVTNFTEVEGLSFSLRLLTDGLGGELMSAEAIHPALASGLQIELEGEPDSLLRFFWSEESGNPTNLSLPDSTDIFHLLIHLTGEPGDCAELVFTDDPLSRIVSRVNVLEAVPSTLDGPVCLPALATLAGYVQRENGNRIQEVEVKCIGADSTWITYTNEEGYYEFKDLLLGEAYTLTPSLDTMHRNGVNIIDRTLMSRHILQSQLLPTPYLRIAADVTGDGSINIIDFVQEGYLILQIFDRFPTNTSWRFVDVEYSFPNPNNPWTETFPESRHIAELRKDSLLNNFIGIKIGDLNDSASSFGGGGTTLDNGMGFWEGQNRATWQNSDRYFEQKRLDSVIDLLNYTRTYEAYALLFAEQANQNVSFGHKAKTKNIPFGFLNFQLPKNTVGYHGF